MPSKRTKALQFDNETIINIMERDQGCIFCEQEYYMNASREDHYSIYDIMHIVGKAQGGLGIEQNGVLGCRYHHNLMDDGNKGLHSIMQQMIEEYMTGLYPGWDRRNLVYKKW